MKCLLPLGRSGKSAFAALAFAAVSGLLACSGGGPRVYTLETQAADEAANNADQTNAGEDAADTAQSDTGSASDADSVSESPDGDLTNATGDSQALAALQGEGTAGAFCRWQAVIESGSSEADDPISECEQRALECEQGVQQAGSEGQLPEVFARLSDQLTAIEACSLAAQTVDACMAEMIPVLEPYAETMACGEEPGEFPSLLERAAELPTCFALILTCPQLLETLQGSLGAP